MAKESVSLRTLLRAVVILSVPTLLILAGFVVMQELDITVFMLSYLAVVVLTAILIYPIMSNVQALTNYVRDIAEDRKPQELNLGFLNIASNLSSALVSLHRNWMEKKNQLESIITEREILVDSLPDMLVMCDEEQKIVRTNRAARLMFGQNLAGRLLKEVFNSDTLLNTITAVYNDMKGREVDFHIDEPEPKELKAVIERFPIASKGGIALIITLNDVTQLKRIQRMRADFVANASHEIRTPLTSISGLVETLRGPAKNDYEAHDKFLEMMADQAERMKNLITDLLSLSKIEMNAHSIPESEVDVVPLIYKERDHFEWAAKNKNITLRLDFSDNLPKIRGEENELRQVLHNLIGNAIKYGFSDSEVAITVRVTSDLPRDTNFVKLNRAMIVSVRDQGEGIAKEHLPRLTERFYRVDSARTRKIGGTGLGLAIVKHIIHRHRGHLRIESVVGQGSSFSVYLPLSEDV